MTNEKSMEELKAELESLRKMNLEREMSFEREKLELAKKAEEEKQKTFMKEELRAEIMEEMKGQSTVKEEKVEKLSSISPELLELQNSAKKYGVKVERYEDRLRRISNGGFKGGR